MRAIQDRVNVITAGPSAGKSSLCRDLSARGYRTLPEAARILFDQRISVGQSPEEVRQEESFHENVEEIDRRIERQISGEVPIFLDRSLVDNIVYRLQSGETEEISRLKEECRERYDNIFLLERLEMVDDEVREEDEEQAQEIHQLLRETYEDLGYDVIEVPLMPVDDRALLVEDEITRPPPIH